MPTHNAHFPLHAGLTGDPVLIGVARGLAELYGPVTSERLPRRLARMAERIDEGRPPDATRRP